MTIPVFGRVQHHAIRASSSTLQETRTRGSIRMDDRQQQLVAAAEALRTWVHAQKAMWAQGYPQSLVHAHAQLAPSSSAAIDMPAPFGEIASAAAPSWPASSWPDADSP